MPWWFVYVVRCRDGSLYTGISTDVDARVAVHNGGKAVVSYPLLLISEDRQ